MANILIVEDDPAISGLISMYLTVAGYHCLTAFDGGEALELIGRQGFDLALLDVMVPEIDGFSLIPHMRERGIPVIFVTARTEVSDRVKGLRLGAEDYILKPFDIMELLVRVEKVLSRSLADSGTFTVAGVTIDEAQHLALLDGAPVELAPMEFALMLTLAKHPGMVFSREQLLSAVWGDEFFGETRTVDVHIAELRRKLHWQDAIQTVYRIGYRMRRDI